MGEFTSFQCPYCATMVRVMEGTHWMGYDSPSTPMYVHYASCAHCKRLVVWLCKTKVVGGDIFEKEMVYPKGLHRPLHPSVPETYRQDFAEACAVFSLSPQASAALSRRILQTILREHFGISKRSLAKEIAAFIARPEIPSHIANAVDAVRVVGNLAAHPLKDTNTGEIVPVEPREAEWLLDVLEALFDYAFIQPELERKKVDALNAKLGAWANHR